MIRWGEDPLVQIEHGPSRLPLRQLSPSASRSHARTGAPGPCVLPHLRLFMFLPNSSSWPHTASAILRLPVSCDMTLKPCSLPRAGAKKTDGSWGSRPCDHPRFRPLHDAQPRVLPVSPPGLEQHRQACPPVTDNSKALYSSLRNFV